MKKKILVLGLILVMFLTGCGGKKATEEEAKALDKYAEELDEQAEGLFKFKFNKDKGSFDMIIPEDTYIVSFDSLKEGIESRSKYISEEIGKDFTHNAYYEDIEDSIIISAKNGEIEKDNMEKFFKEHKDRYKPNSYETEDSYYKFTGAELSKDKYLGDKIVVLKLEFTNKSDEAQNPWISFITDLKVIQEVDSSIVSLQDASGSLPSSYGVSATDILSKEIKAGATVELIVGYKLDNDTSDVKIVDLWTDGSNFEKTYTIN